MTLLAESAALLAFAFRMGAIVWVVTRS